MKKTQRTALFADIRKTIISFISITLFVALGIVAFLGIGVFLGIKWNEPALAETSKQYYNKHSYRFVGYIEISGGDRKRNHTAETRKGVAVQYQSA